MANNISVTFGARDMMRSGGAAKRGDGEQRARVVKKTEESRNDSILKKTDELPDLCILNCNRLSSYVAWNEEQAN